MKRACTYIVSLITVGCITACSYALPPPYPGPFVAKKQSDRWERAIERHAQHGDWILMRGYTPFHTLVSAAGNTPWSHVGIYDAHARCIIDAAPLGVRTKPLHTYLWRMHHMQVVRPHQQSPQRAAAAVQFARSRVGRGYDIGIAVGRPHPERWTCVELMLDAYSIRVHSQPDRRALFPHVLHRFGSVVYDTGPRVRAPACRPRCRSSPK